MSRYTASSSLGGPNTEVSAAVGHPGNLRSEPVSHRLFCRLQDLNSGSLWVLSLHSVPGSPAGAGGPSWGPRQAADTWKALVGQHSSLALQEQRRWLPKVNATSRAHGQHQWAALKRSNMAPSGRTPTPEHQCLHPDGDDSLA